MLLILASLMLIDAALVLWNEDRFRRALPKAHLRRWALIEAGIAIVLSLLHFLYR